MNNNIDKTQLNTLKSKYERLSELLTYEEVLLDKKLFLNLEKQRQSMENVVNKYNEYLNCEKNLLEIDEVISNIAGDEKQLFINEKEQLMEKFEFAKLHLLKELSKYNAVMQSVRVEIVANDDFLSLDLLDTLSTAYSKYCENNGFDFKLTNTSNGIELTINGLNAKLIFEDIKGVHLGKYESDEGSVRVFVFDGVEEKSFDEKDVTLSACRSSGAGGQHVNTTDSAIKATHLPTGICAICQDERSQFQNKEKALQNLKEKVENYYQQQINKSLSDVRKKQLNEMKKNRYVRVYDFKNNTIISDKKEIGDISSLFEGKII